MKEGLLEYSTSETPIRDCKVKVGSKVILLNPERMYGLTGIATKVAWEPLYNGSSNKSWRIHITLDLPFISRTLEGFENPPLVNISRSDTEVEPA